MSEPLITSQELELRLTPTVYTRVFNDYNLGEVNAPAELQLRKDASSKVRGALANTYDLESLSASNPLFAQELRRITLDVAHAMCATRNPTVVLIDGTALIGQAEKELERLRQDITTLFTESRDSTAGGSSNAAAGSPTHDWELEPTVDTCGLLPGLGNFYG